MLFLCVGKNPLNGFFALSVKRLVFRGVSGVIGQFLVILPNVAQDSLYTVRRAGAQLPGGALGTNLGIAAVFPVSVPVGGAVRQRLIFRANDTVDFKKALEEIKNASKKQRKRKKISLQCSRHNMKRQKRKSTN